MLPTFSVNPDTYKLEKLEKIMELLSNLEDNDLTREWLSEAYIKLIEGNYGDNVNLSAYSHTCNKNQNLSKMAKHELSLITQNEADEGHIGITEIPDYTEDKIEDLIEDIDMDSNIKEFLRMRELVFLKLGIDLWRLVELAMKEEDAEASNELKNIMEMKKFRSIRNLLNSVLRDNKCLSILEGMLC